MVSEETVWKTSSGSVPAVQRNSRSQNRFRRILRKVCRSREVLRSVQKFGWGIRVMDGVLSVIGKPLFRKMNPVYVCPGAEAIEPGDNDRFSGIFPNKKNGE